MMKRSTLVTIRRRTLATVFGLFSVSGVIFYLQAADDPEIQTNHAECVFFTPEGEEMTQENLHRSASMRRRDRAGLRTMEVAAQLGRALRAKSASSELRANPALENLDKLGFIDQILFKAMKDNAVIPAERSNDYEFIRRVTFDLTGRPATYQAVVDFVNSNDPDKRRRLVDGLLNTEAWADKWAMFFGDLYKNTEDNTQVRRHAEGRNAFHKYIRESLAADKPYDQMVTEMITASGPNSWEKGELNWNLGGLMTGGPAQDNFDLMAENVSKVFLGISHVNCIVCHNGRGHLESISAWGQSATRTQAWGLAAFFAKTTTRRVAIDPNLRNSPYYFTVEDNPRAADYSLNTTTGNRPPRQPIGGTRTITPEYPFGEGGKPNPGENYRAALARLLTRDKQFARASVNYLWKEFFGRGIVDPVNQFDPARLDPSNPPRQPWGIQPANSALLEALAEDFQKSGFKFKDLMRKLVLSEAYQLSSAHDAWKPEWEKYFARHFVRRLWAEEITDAISQVSGFLPTYTFNTSTLAPTAGGTPNATANFAMQLPQTGRLPGGAMGQFLDTFLRGNRIDAERKDEGSIPQVLNLLNDTFVLDRTRSAVRNGTPTLARRLLDKYPADQNNALLDELFLTVLNRPITDGEKITAQASLNTAITPTVRQQRVEDLVWSLYNKVDFIFNY